VKYEDSNDDDDYNDDYIDNRVDDHEVMMLTIKMIAVEELKIDT
jgi:hypothetical protein